MQNTPVSSELRRAGVATLSAALFELHGLLITAATNAYRAEHGPIAGPGHLLQLLTEDPAFSWLRPLSSHMAELDHADSKGDLELLAKELRAIEELFTEGSEFGKRYFATFQESPDVVMAHAAMMTALRGTRVVN